MESKTKLERAYDRVADGAAVCDRRACLASGEIEGGYVIALDVGYNEALEGNEFSFVASDERAKGCEKRIYCRPAVERVDFAKIFDKRSDALEELADILREIGESDYPEFPNGEFPRVMFARFTYAVYDMA